MSEIAIIGDSDIISVFAPLGIDVHHAPSPERAREVLTGLIKGRRHKIIFITAGLAVHMVAELQATEASDVVVVPLPDHTGGGEVLEEEMKRIAREAIGMEV
jgi:vacuolar-type H+-ATPase subunit F/Vma7